MSFRPFKRDKDTVAGEVISPKNARVARNAQDDNCTFH